MIKFERHKNELMGYEILTDNTYIIYVRKMYISSEKENKNAEFNYANSFAQLLTERNNYYDYDIKPVKNSIFYSADLYSHYSVTFKKDIKKEFKF